MGWTGTSPLVMAERTSDPSAIAENGQLYVKEASSRSELWFIDDAGNTTQITNAGRLNTSEVGLLTTKGDLWTFSTVNARLAVGSDGQVLKALASEATGLVWGDAGGSLDAGYDTGGAGAGRTITVDTGAVDLTGGGSSAQAGVLTLSGSQAMPSAASAVWNGFYCRPAVSLSGSTNVTTATGFNMASFEAPTITDAGTITSITNSATVYISGAPAGSGLTITNAYALWVDAGAARLDGDTTVGGELSVTGRLRTSAAADVLLPDITAANDTDTGITFLGDTIALTTSGLGVGLRINAFASVSVNSSGYASGGAALNVTQTALASDNPQAFAVIAGAHTACTASAETIDVDFDLDATLQHATGAITTQRCMVIRPRAYSFVGASTVTTAVGVSIVASPSAGSNATFTNTYGLQVGGTVTIGATSASMTYGAVNLPAYTVTVTGTTQVTSVGFAQQRIGILTITDSSAVTIDTAASLYIAGAPAAAGSVTLTASYALWVDAGIARFDGSVLIGGTAIETGSTNTLSIFNGTAPDNGVADTVQFYSSDNSAGHTIPSWYTEGTEAVMTGQLDIASANRLRVRVNGTVYQILCV